MSEALEESPDLTKSWVFVDSAKATTVDEIDGQGTSPDAAATENFTSGVEDTDNKDSDTDSICVISESGNSSSISDEEFTAPTTSTSEKEEENNYSDDGFKRKLMEDGKEDILDTLNRFVFPIVEQQEHQDYAKVDKLICFATSALCAVIIVGFSVAVQQYFQGKADIDSFSNELDQSDFSYPYCIQSEKQNEYRDNVNKETRRKQYKRKHQEPSSKRINSVNEFNVHENKLHEYQQKKHKNHKHNNNQSLKKHQTENTKKIHKDTPDEFVHTDILHEAENVGDNYNKMLEELKLKEEYLREKEKFLIKKEHNLLKREMKVDKHKNNDKTKENKKYDKNLDQESRKKGDKSYKNDEIEKNDKYKDKNYSKNDRPKFRDDERHFKKRNITGQWYINLNKARTDLRQQEHASDWLFERAHLRSLKRNKAHWYFQWMVDRERLRTK